jgi:hypothetical protein
MGGWKLRVRAGQGARVRGARARGVIALGAAGLGIAALVSACAHGVSAMAMAVAATPTPAATPTLTPTSAPGLGAMTLGTFPSTTDGTRALMLCEQWAGLRGQYAGRLRADSRYELEQWFSGDDWLPSFSDDSPLRNDPEYVHVSVGFGLVSTAQAASVANARFLDQSCAAAD